MAQGEHAIREELTTDAFGDSRGSTMLALEGEYAFGYTRIAGELLRNRLQSHERGRNRAYAWFIQGMQTVTPRMFVAGTPGRHVGTAAANRPPPRGRTTFQTTEATSAIASSRT